MISASPQIVTNPTDKTPAFAEPPLTGWVWKYAVDLETSDFSSDVSGTVRIALGASFLLDIAPGDFVFVTIMGRVRVVSKNSSSILTDFDASGFTPAGGEIRLMKSEDVNLEVDSRQTPIKINGGQDGIRRLNPYAIIRRAFDYLPPSGSATHWLTYKLSISATAYTALRSTGGTIDKIWGVWPYVAYFQDALVNLGAPQKLPVLFSPGTPVAINNTTYILTPSATQRVILAQRGTPFVIRIQNETFQTEPNTQPPWLEIEQSGNDILLTGTIPMTGDSWNLDYVEGANEYLVSFTVMPGIYNVPFCADRLGFTWLGRNGQWRTYYFDGELSERFEEFNGTVVRTEGKQRFVGLDEFREAFGVGERYLDNETMEWLKDLEVSPAIYLLPGLQRYYIVPNSGVWRNRPKKAENNSVQFVLIASDKTPTIYEG